MVAINLKLSPERDYEMQVARVVGSQLPWGYKKRFFMTLCRAVITPEMSDDDARERVIRVVEEGLRAIQSTAVSEPPNEIADEQPLRFTDAEDKPEPVVEPPSRPSPQMGTMFRVS